MRIATQPESFFIDSLTLRTDENTLSKSWFCNKKILRGCTLSYEECMFNVDFPLRKDMKSFYNTWNGLDEEARNTFYQDKVLALYPRTEDEYIDCCNRLYNVPKETALLVKNNPVQRLDLAIAYNGFGIQNESLLFDKTSFYNSSCDANSVFAISNQRITVVALRDIEVGEEITINYAYGNERESVENRRKVLYFTCFFLCNCSRCTKEQKCKCCNVQQENLLCCSRCKIATYCSKECQKKNWSSHKSTCISMNSPPNILKLGDKA